jgi:hypothetical protein
MESAEGAAEGAAEWSKMVLACIVLIPMKLHEAEGGSRCQSPLTYWLFVRGYFWGERRREGEDEDQVCKRAAITWRRAVAASSSTHPTYLPCLPEPRVRIYPHPLAAAWRQPGDVLEAWPERLRGIPKRKQHEVRRAGMEAKLAAGSLTGLAWMGSPIPP